MLGGTVVAEGSQGGLGKLWVTMTPSHSASQHRWWLDGTVVAKGFQGAWGHYGRLGGTMGAGRHCGRLRVLQLAEGLREEVVENHYSLSAIVNQGCMEP